MMQRLRMTTPLGFLGITLGSSGLEGIDLFCDTGDWETGQGGTDAERQLAAYFADGSHRFSLPLLLHGTPFQQRVWAALRRIPPGEVRTYGQLARTLGSGARAVGSACRRNPVPLVVPCHRVVGAGGLGGYSGAVEGSRLAVKRWLLKHEGAVW